VPWSFGEANARYVFPMHMGERYYVPGEIFMNERNGLFLHKDNEKAMNDGELVILPCRYDDSTRFKAYISDEILKGGTFGPTGKYSWNDIHQEELQFRNRNRPARAFSLLSNTHDGSP